MQNIKTIAGTFTIGTYEIPKQYVCAKTPTITQKNDICEIVTYDQQITVNGHNYAKTGWNWQIGFCSIKRKSVLLH
jgi:hypothetical protein